VTHPLLDILLEAARGRPPAADGRIDVLPALQGPVDAVVTFPARAYLVADVDPDLVRGRLPPGDPGAPTLPASPGNAASLRAVLAAGYAPIGSEVLIPRG